MKNIQPLKVWLQNTLPTVYDDSLTYQDLLYKVLEKLNEVINSQNNVLDYINTVDFKELVEEGLQELIDDGTIESLINEQLFKDMRDSINKTIKPYFCVDEFGATGDGITNDTAAFNAAIAACPVGSTITTKGKQYLVDNLYLTKSVNFDFNGGTIINGQIFFESAPESTAYPLSTADSLANSVTLTGANPFASGDIVVLESSESYHPTRSYYTKGGMYRVTFVDGAVCGIEPQLIYDLNSAGATLKKCVPITTSIKNGHFTCNTPVYTRFGVRINYGVDCIIENCTFEKRRTEIHLQRCYNSTVRNCTLNENYDNTKGDFYGISVNSCTYTLIDQVTGRAGQHMITTGGDICNQYTTIRDSEMYSIASLQTYGFSDHENAYGTLLDGCVVCAAYVANGFKAVNTSFVGRSLPAGQYLQAPEVAIAGNATGAEQNVYFNGCDFTGLDVTARSDPQSGGTAGTYCGNVYIDNCVNFNVRINNNVNVTTGGKLVISNSQIEGGIINAVQFDELYVLNSSSNHTIDARTTDFIFIDNVHIQSGSAYAFAVTTCQDCKIANSVLSSTNANIAYFRQSMGNVTFTGNTIMGGPAYVENTIACFSGSGNINLTVSHPARITKWNLENTQTTSGYLAYLNNGSANYKVQISGTGFVVSGV